MSSSLFGVDNIINANVKGTLVPQSFIGTAGQTVFPITNFTYVVGTNSLQVYVNGSLQTSGRDYTETSNNSFTLSQGVFAGDFVDIIGFPEIDLTAVPPGTIILGGTYTLSNYLSDLYVNVKSAPWYCKGNGVTDDTAAWNAVAEFARINNKVLYMPAGVYVGTQFVYGTQSVVGQSSAPLGIVGEGWGTLFLSKSGSTVTLLAAKGIGGSLWRGFQLDGNGNNITLVDTSYGVVAPSLHNKFEYIRAGNSVLSSANGSLWNATNNNDCDFYHIVVVGSNPSVADQICLNLTASGGSNNLNDVYCANGYLKLGVQNGKITGGWVFGIMFAAGAVNNVNIVGTQFFENFTLKTHLVSESFSSFQSVGALTLQACWFIATGIVTKIADLNVYSRVLFDGCNIPASAAVNLLGPNTRSDSFAPVLVQLNGGQSSSSLTLNDVGSVIVEARQFNNTTTGHNFDKNWAGTSNLSVAGATTAGTATYSSRVCSYIRQGNIVHYAARLTWTTATGTGQLLITGFPFTNSIEGIASFGYTGTTFITGVYARIAGSQLSIFNVTGTAVAVPAAGDIIITGSYVAVAS